ncbi:unnamed protein product [Gongylonema pulchrum]|uniref:3'-5' exonuclease domain-containing protein n=1 Tax=Gongylonema pulchrum TaxID=637853 RepID=A0A183EZV4_9BILA|nr:unnamed protein product [Gongylonema pulchrum]
MERRSVANMELFPGHPIRMIADVDDIARLYPVIANADIIGIDTEWKPLFMSTTEQVKKRPCFRLFRLQQKFRLSIGLV